MDSGAMSKGLVEGVGEGVVHSILINPLFVAVLATTVIMLIITFMYSADKKIKTGFYIFCTNVLIIFLHNKLLLTDYRKKICDKDMESVCASINVSPDEEDLNDGLNYLDT